MRNNKNGENSAGQAVYFFRILVCALICGFVILKLINVVGDFSYDYDVYIYYFRIIGQYRAADFVESFLYYFPLPYVYIPPNALFEIGFVFVTWSLLGIGFTPVTTYAMIGGVSVILRSYVLIHFKTPIYLSILILITSTVLYEANAVRLGVCASILACGIISIYKGNDKVGGLLVFLSIIFHIQSAIYMAGFGVGYALTLITRYSPSLRTFLFFSGVAAMAVISETASVSSGVKIQDYLNKGDVATAGFNLLSVTSLLALVFGFRSLSSISTELAKLRWVRIWMASYFATWQALLLLIFGDQFADIGIRLWQFAFFIFIIINEYTILRAKSESIQIEGLDYVSKINLVCLFILFINITIRYPLSNLFVPIIPYQPLTLVPVI